MADIQELSIAKPEIDRLMAEFFGAVSFDEGQQPHYERIYSLFVEAGLLIKNSAATPEISSIAQFIAPRQATVSAGELTSFRETELAENTQIFGNVAQRFSAYAKAGSTGGAPFAARGMIATQFIRTPAGWRISAMAWDDERPGLALPAPHLAIEGGQSPEPALIRACTEADIDQVVQLDRQWEQEQIAFGDFNPIGREAFLAELERFPAYFLVAESGGRLVGYLNASAPQHTRVEVIPEQEPYLEIENIYVLPAFRNRAIGGTLIERLFAIAEQHGIRRFVVGSRSKDMEHILKFYRRHGFTLWSVHLFR